MEIPDLLRQRLDEEPRGGVTLGGEDVAVFTRNRTFIYRGESLLSDARVEVYGHDIERLSVSSGRRETTFRLHSVEGTRGFAVASEHAQAVLEGLFGGILAAAGLLEDGEHVRGVYLFSDLTVVVTDRRLVKHIGATVWDSDYEEFPFESVTGLDFEEGSVATQVVLWVDGKAERIKAPSDEGPLLRRTLSRALCEFHGVDALDQVDRFEASHGESSSDTSLALEEGITPLIDSAEGSDGDPTSGWATLDAESTGSGRPDPAPTEGDESSARSTAEGALSGRGNDIEALSEQVAELARAVDRQNELLERQSRQLDELAGRLDDGD